MKVKSKRNNVIEIEDKPFAQGGQGGIHNVISQTYNFPVVAKIYHKSKEALAAQRKIEFMVGNDPFSKSNQNIQDTFAWPLESIYNIINGDFIGYLMLKVTDAKPLWGMTQAAGFSDLAWQKFNLSNKDALIIRLKLIYNVAQALKILEDSKIYRVVDLKPVNMMLQELGHIVIIDTDSFQIKSQNNVFHAEVATPEYCPPECYIKNIDYTKVIVEESWDLFAFSVTAYQILFNLHPFTLSHPKYSTIEELIKAGIWAHQSRKCKGVILPPPHANFYRLSKTIQNQFKQCFDDGHKDPYKRPNFDSWIKVLVNEITHTKKHNISLIIPQKKGKRNRNVGNKGNPIKVVNPPQHIPPPPPTPLAVINYFRIRPSGINQAVLEWNVSGSVSVHINGASHSTFGRMTILSNNKGNYNLVAYNANHQITRRTISHTPDIRIVHFRYIINSGSVDLEWQVRGQIRSIFINGKRQNNLSKGSIRLPLQQVQKNNTLKVVSSNGFIYETNANITSLVKMNHFTKTFYRNYAIISWDVENVNHVLLNSVPHPSNGRLRVDLVSKTYNLEAMDFWGGILNKSLRISIKPQIRDFSTVIDKYSGLLRWDIWYAKKIKIDGISVDSAYGNKRIPFVSRNFEITVTDFDGYFYGRTTYFSAPPEPTLNPTADIKDPIAEIKGAKLKSNIATIKKGAKLKNNLATIRKGTKLKNNLATIKIPVISKK